MADEDAITYRDLIIFNKAVQTLDQSQQRFNPMFAKALNDNNNRIIKQLQRVQETFTKPDPKYVALMQERSAWQSELFKQGMEKPAVDAAEIEYQARVARQESANPELFTAEQANERHNDSLLDQEVGIVFKKVPLSMFPAVSRQEIAALEPMVRENG